VSTTPRPVTDETARGVVSPPWLKSLPGIERMRLYASRVLPATPFARLTGFGIGHVSTGTLTGTLKASGHLVMPPAYNLAPLSTQSLYACATTAVEAGMDVDPITVSVHALGCSTRAAPSCRARPSSRTRSAGLSGSPPASGAYVESLPRLRRLRPRSSRPTTRRTRRQIRRTARPSGALCLWTCRPVTADSNCLE
jgi:hypothetical protein